MTNLYTRMFPGEQTIKPWSTSPKIEALTIPDRQLISHLQARRGMVRMALLNSFYSKMHKPLELA